MMIQKRKSFRGWIVAPVIAVNNVKQFSVGNAPIPKSTGESLSNHHFFLFYFSLVFFKWHSFFFKWQIRTRSRIHRYSLIANIFTLMQHKYTKKIFWVYFFILNLFFSNVYNKKKNYWDLNHLKKRWWSKFFFCCTYNYFTVHLLTCMIIS